MVMDEVEFLMEIAASHAIWKYSGQMRAQELQCLQYLVQMPMYKGHGAFLLDGSYICSLALQRWTKPVEGGKH